MKDCKLRGEEFRTLREMGIYHPHARVRMRAQGVLRLSQGCALREVADEFEVHLNSVEHWWQRWKRIGLMGLYEGWHSGRPPKLSKQDRQALRKLAKEEGGSSGRLLRLWRERQGWSVSRSSIRRYLKQMHFRYKRYRLSLKDKRDAQAFERGQRVMASLQAWALTGQCELLYFDESGFGPNPPVQYGWTPVCQTRYAQSGAHGQRVNVLGALGHDNRLIWRAYEKRIVREDVIGFLDQIAQQSHSVPRIVVLDNAGIHKGQPMAEKCRQWEQQDLYLYYLPPYSPELNRIEILWKQAKYYCRRFLYLAGNSLRDEVHFMMQNYGKAFTINFA